MNQNPTQIAFVKLAKVSDASSAVGGATTNIESKVIRSSVKRTKEDGSLFTTSEFSRKVIEETPDWLVHIAKSIESIRNSNKGSVAINHGSGFCTVVLLNTDVLPKDISKIHRVGIDVCVADSESDGDDDNRCSEYGIVTPSDCIYEHIRAGLSQYKNVRVYLHPTLKSTPVIGDWESPSSPNSQHSEEKRRVFRCVTAKDDPNSVARLHREFVMEKILAKGTVSTSNQKSKSSKKIAPEQQTKKTETSSAKTGEDNTGKPAPKETNKVSDKQSKTVPKSPAEQKNSGKPISKETNKVSDKQSKPAQKSQAEPLSRTKNNPSTPSRDGTLSIGTTITEPPTPRIVLGFNPKQLVLLEKAFHGKGFTKAELKDSGKLYDEKTVELARKLGKKLEKGIKTENAEEKKKEKKHDGETGKKRSESKESKGSQESPKKKQKTDKKPKSPKKAKTPPPSDSDED